MDVDYKTKFDQLRAYIPFLNNMIEKLETAGTGNNNPRHAQWKKIKALRDLLLENNKKLKMENLFKCEQVLINLYSKVEQNELTTQKITNSESGDLKTVRQKLMNVTQKQDSPSPSTVCMAANTDQLYQRRPIKNTTSPTTPPKSNNIESDANSKTYTCVLHSPEKGDSNDPSEHSVRPSSPLYHRRSPKPLNHHTSPIAHRKQRKRAKRSRRHDDSAKEDINITLNVPTESLNSLNTKDIFERIMSCRDTDVDIEQLSKLRSKILDELKETGANQDISDLILQSYKKKKNKSKDVEEGELSDSDSDTLEKVYGNLVIELKNESNVINEKTKTVLDSTNSKQDNESRNIKISLILSNLNKDSEDVIKLTKESTNEEHYSFYKLKENSNTKIKDLNSDVVQVDSAHSTQQTTPTTSLSNNTSDKNKNECSSTKQAMPTTSVCANTSDKNKSTSDNKNESSNTTVCTKTSDKNKNESSTTKQTTSTTSVYTNTSDKNKSSSDKHINVKQTIATTSTCTKTSEKSKNDSSTTKQTITTTSTCTKASDKNERSSSTKQENVKYAANFYKDQNNDDNKNGKEICIKDTLSQFNNKASDQQIKESYKVNDTTLSNKKIENEKSSKVGTRKEITEIDILKALKNEILNESIDIPKSVNTPVLHQPKITKVTKIDGSQKRRISLEKYKEKAVSTCATNNRINPLYIHDPDFRIHDKAQSRGLTEKERERFFGPEISSDEEDNTKLDVSVEDMQYSDRAPQSPERNVIDNTDSYSPIIIPTDPIETNENTLLDTDMRLLSPVLSNPKLVDNTTKPIESSPMQVRSPLKDPRIKDIAPKHSLSTPIHSYTKGSNSRTSEIPTAETSKELRQSKMSTRDPRCGVTMNDDISEVRYNDSRCLPQQVIQPRLGVDRDPRLNVDNTSRAECSSNYFGRSECPSTPSHSFGRSDGPSGVPPPTYTRPHASTPSHSFGRIDPTPSVPLGRTENSTVASQSFKRTDSPMTPSHPFGRTDTPMTPSHPFGRTDAPMTPSHPFGRTDRPMTPSHPFGRTDTPMTPSHPFGRTDRPMTPSHSFGRTDTPMTPSHPFGRTDKPMTPSHPFGRSDTPMTPSHPFGRSDTPMTPSHPFGRSDTPMTPSHPFGRSDTPMTPSHSFGRSDTPSQPYGNSDSRNRGRFDNQSMSFNRSESSPTQNHPLGRNTKSYNQETRYKMYDDETSDVYANKRDRSYDSTNRFGADESRPFHREGSVYRTYNVERQNDNYDNQRRYTRELSVNRVYNDDDYRNRQESSGHDIDRSRREHSVGRIISHNVGEGKHDAYSRRNNREPSVGNSTKFDEFDIRNRFQRARSVGRTFEKKSELSTTLSVHSHDRSFKIDTSVNRTFQFPVSSDDRDVMDNFNERRKRASSVGRFDAHEFSISKQKFDKYDIKTSNDKRFSRARSVGRQLEVDTNRVFDNFKNNFGSNSRQSVTVEKSNASFYEESNANKRVNYSKYDNESRLSRARSVGKQNTSDEVDFKAKTFSNNLKKIERKGQYSPGDDKIFGGDSKSKHDTSRRGNQNNDTKINDSRSRKEQYDKQQSYYSDDKLNSTSLHRRDPRLNRDSRMYFDSRYKKDNRSSRRGSDRSSYGIVYTHDSISKGTMLASSHGVKNYKIPKIKRVPEEKVDVQESTEENKESTKDHDTRKVAVNVSAANTTHNIDNTEKAVTPHKTTPESKLDVATSDDNTIFKRRRATKTRALSSDSDSERNDVSEKSNEVHDSNTNLNKKNTIKSNEVDVDEGHDNLNKKNTIHDTEKVTSNFDSEEDNRDGDIFNEMPVNDFPVMSKIDDLIANLDEDLNKGVNTESNDNSDNLSISKVVCDKKHIQNVNCNEMPDKNSHSISSVVSEICSGHKLDITTSEKVKNAINECTPNVSEAPTRDNNTETNEKKDIVQETTTKEDINVITSTHQLNEINDSKDLDTIELSQKNNSISSNDIQSLAKSDHDLSLVSDSTTTVAKSNNIESTTNDVFPDSTGEISPEITSTNDSKIEMSNDESSRLKTLDTLMSLVQDKSKINELFAMLDGHSEESNKIKRTLEKLSQIVSEDEDTPAKDDNKEINEKSVLSTVNDSEQLQCSKHDTEKDLNISEEVIQDKKEESFSNEDSGSQDKDKCIKATTELSDLKRVTRPRQAQKKTKHHKKRNEVMKLQEDLKDMFMNSQTLSTTGLRMCRLAKLVDENNLANKKSDVLETVPPVATATKAKTNKKKNDEANSIEMESCEIPEQHIGKPTKKISNIKMKVKSKVSPKLTKVVKNKPGPKSKKIAIINKQIEDPYEFESDSFAEATKGSGSSLYHTSDSEDESLASLKSTVDSEIGIELKPKPKRKKCSWKLGIINKLKKKMSSTKVETNQAPQIKPVSDLEKYNVQCSLDNNSYFIDKNYCFKKKVTHYPCKLCHYEGDEIVFHYKQEHPHIEVPLSRMNKKTADDAMKQCLFTDFKKLQKVATKRQVCRFCFEVFDKDDDNLEAFFRHVVSKHTGEYKQPCTECSDVSNCPITLSIPLPPSNDDGLLLGYICGECNYTQLSLENLKTHVAIRHDNEQTAVYTINIGHMSNKAVNAMVSTLYPSKDTDTSQRTLRSHRNSNTTEDNDENDQEVSNLKLTKKISPIKKRGPASRSVQSKITFESDLSEGDRDSHSTSIIKSELEESDSNINTQMSSHDDSFEFDDVPESQSTPSKCASENLYTDPHFKINITSTATKEYVCCINGNKHYSHNLLISMKKHVQLKHKEIWDGYCCLCKVIVTPQGKHDFKVCLDHFLDKHMDEFPILENRVDTPDNNTVVDELGSHEKEVNSDPGPASKSYINVRPLSELMFNHSPMNTPVEETEDDMSLPRIQSVVSLNINETPIDNKPEEEILPFINNDLQNRQSTVEEISHEVEQEKIMSQKHQIVLQSMLLPEKLVQIFKCAGHYCSFTTDSPEEAFVHASAHQRIGGLGTLRCIYCAYSVVNGIDLVSHVFREHGQSQYACKLCIYRAASIPSVEYHIGRKHSNTSPQGCVLTSSVVPGANKQLHQPTPLARTDAVPLYICTKDTAVGRCKFRHYTPGKFMEHMRQSHPNEDSFECSFCAQSYNSQLLIDHLREHGLHLYQCVWCVNGFDSETKFVDHISLMHPDRKPSAYLRHIIDNPNASEGNIPKTKVLPMVTVNNPLVTALPIPIASNTDSPEKEAERAIDLEQLIGATQVMIDNKKQPDITPDKPDKTIETFNKSLNNRGVSITLVQKGSECAAVAIDSDQNTVTENSSLFDTTIQNVIQPTSLDKNTTLMKVEPITSNKDLVRSSSSDSVICLSDDEQPSEADPQVVDVSDEERVTDVIPNVTIEVCHGSDEQQHRYPLNELFKCSQCRTVCKKPHGFRVHIVGCCLSKQASMKCYYCPYNGSEVDAIVQHYLLQHGFTNLPRCPQCQYIEITASLLKRHMLACIKDTDAPMVFRHIAPKGGKMSINEAATVYKNMASKRKQSTGDAPTAFRKIAPKRKQSTGDAPSPAKLRRYGPDDIHLLPINQIIDEGMHCALCQFNTKVRINMLRHLQQHAELGPVASIAPINPVPLLESNERHFDKMANLAASSNQARVDRTPATAAPAKPSHLYAISFPQFVPERKRHACGAVGCSYISVDEATLRCHWDTLHSGAVVYRCIHCSPSQKLDPSRALTSARIIAHNKMHDERLYACSACQYYHYQRHLVEKHVLDKHAAGVARVSTVREPVPVVDSMLSVAAPVGLPAPPAPSASMDLQPWHCGLCEFGSMLRHDVVNHCGTVHASKFQYRCAFCQYRSSACESVIRHHTASHPGMVGEVFHFFYKEGSLPLEPDGSPLWMRQRRESDLAKMTTVIKGDVDEPAPTSSTTEMPVVAPIDLNLVKTEVVDDPDPLKTAMDIYGPLCDPKGSQFVCPLCKNTVEGSRDDMTAHLYEELNYRKWSCGFCPYKSFSKVRLMEHIRHEHRRSQQEQEPVALPPNDKIELWVSKLLDHQEKKIEENNKTDEQTAPDMTGPRYTLPNLIKEFGPLGSAVKEFFKCPRCKYQHLDKKQFYTHLTTEVTCLRYGCTRCDAKFLSGDDAWRHCTKDHYGQASSITEMSKNLEMRKAWVDAVIDTQSAHRAAFLKTYSTGQSMCPNTEEDSLLLVRYEEKVPTPEVAAGRRRDTTTTECDSDEERLIIDEPSKTKDPSTTPPDNKFLKCPYCPFSTKFKLSLNDHTLRHFKLKPYECGVCNVNGFKAQIYKHFKDYHPGLPPNIKKVDIPDGPPLVTNLTRVREKYIEAPGNTTVCLLCESNIPESVTREHMASLHPNCEGQFAKKGTVVYKCRTCLKLEPTLESITLHYQKEHPNDELNYSLFKLGSHCTREAVVCIHCKVRFKYAADFRIHLETMHANLKDNTNVDQVINVEGPEEPYNTVAIKRHINPDTPIEPVRKKTARKSTTKLPKLTARKSTSKLPLLPGDEQGYSFYGTKPSMEQYCNVTTNLPFFGTMMSFTLRKLQKTININPKVIVEDCL